TAGLAAWRDGPQPLPARVAERTGRGGRLPGHLSRPGARSASNQIAGIIERLALPSCIPDWFAGTSFGSTYFAGSSSGSRRPRFNDRRGICGITGHSRRGSAAIAHEISPAVCSVLSERSDQLGSGSGAWLSAWNRGFPLVLGQATVAISIVEARS